MRFVFPLVLIANLYWSCVPGGNASGNGESSLPGFDSTSVKQASEAEISKMPFEGNLIQSISWTDKAGKNTLIFSGKPAFPIDEDMRRAEFFAYTYADDQTGASSLLWQISETVDSCYCDCAVELIDSPVVLRDLDQDGYAEAAFMFFLNDLCDASPMDTKLIIASRNQTYFLEGYTRRFLAPSEPHFKKISTSENFGQASSEIREFARHYWDSYLQNEQSAFENVQKGSKPLED